jgi:hypothetical protein
VIGHFHHSGVAGLIVKAGSIDQKLQERVFLIDSGAEKATAPTLRSGLLRLGWNE